MIIRFLGSSAVSGHSQGLKTGSVEYAFLSPDLEALMGAEASLHLSASLEGEVPLLISTKGVNMAIAVVTGTSTGIGLATALGGLADLACYRN
jgi:hypothetical protein